MIDVFGYVVVAMASAFIFWNLGSLNGKMEIEKLLEGNGLEIRTTPEKREIVKIEPPKQ